MLLQHLFNTNNTLLRTEGFSRSIQETHGDIKLIFPMSDVEELYKKLTGTVKKSKPTYTFIIRGWDTIRSAVGRGSDKYLMSGNIAYQLYHICKDNLGDVPPWLPVVIQKRTPKDHAHQFLYLFDWSTVMADCIPNNLCGYFTLRLKSESTGKTRDNTSPALREKIKNIPALSKTPLDKKHDSAKLTDSIEPGRAKASIKPQGLSSDVKHGIYVARKYLSLIESAQSRSHEFNLTIEELSEILRMKTCYFTKKGLVHFPHDPKEVEKGVLELPKNYLSIDRLDASKGYVSGNVVSCSLAINKVKGQMGEDEFSKLMDKLKVLSDVGIGASELEILNQIAAV
jgi:hypothetical protein